MKETIDGVLNFFAALSNLALAAAYLLTWAGAMPADAGTSVRHLAYVVLVEFILLMLGLPLLIFLVGPLKAARKHPALFYAWTGSIVVALVIAGLSLSASAGSSWPILSVMALLGGRMKLYVHPPRTQLETNQILADTVVRLSAMFLLLLPCVLIPFPSWGVPRSMVEFPDVRPAGLMVWGALYFGLMGLFRNRLDAMVASD